MNDHTSQKESNDAGLSRTGHLAIAIGKAMVIFCASTNPVDESTDEVDDRDDSNPFAARPLAVRNAGEELSL
jgi:hypothetical protein